MKRNIIEVEGWLILLPIDKVESISHFSCEHEEYNVFLREEALRYEKLNISRTHLLINSEDSCILAYMSLVADSVQLSKNEKVLVELGLVPFSTFPAIKIGKLAVDRNAGQQYYGIGSLMIQLARGFTYNLNDCRGRYYVRYRLSCSCCRGNYRKCPFEKASATKGVRINGVTD